MPRADTEEVENLLDSYFMQAICSLGRCSASLVPAIIMHVLSVPHPTCNACRLMAC